MEKFYDLNGNDELAEKFGWAQVVKPALLKSDLQREARRIRKEADVIIASGGPDIARVASECWEVDIIGSPEMHEEKDFMHQMNSGIDYVIARACAERGIAVEFNFSNVLWSNGRKRAQILARMAQNVRICRDTGCDMIITSGAKDRYGLRGPRELISFGIILGMGFEEAKAAVSATPEKILKRSKDRRNPNILLKGLEVKRWSSKQKEKRIYGWY